MTTTRRSTDGEPADTEEVPPAIAFRAVQEIVRTFQRSGWTGLTLELHGLRVTVGKHGPPAGSAIAAPAPAGVAPAPAVAPPAPSSVPVPAAAPAAPPSAPPSSGEVDTTGCVAVRSPAVGSFWTAPSPGQPPFVAVGQPVAADDQLAIVEVMKLMNPVTAPVAGTVAAVAAGNAELVEYDQVLFWIRADDA